MVAGNGVGGGFGCGGTGGFWRVVAWVCVGDFCGVVRVHEFPPILSPRVDFGDGFSVPNLWLTCKGKILDVGRGTTWVETHRRAQRAQRRRRELATDVHGFTRMDFLGICSVSFVCSVVSKGVFGVGKCVVCADAMC